MAAVLANLPLVLACTHPTWRDVAHAGEEEQFMEVRGHWQDVPGGAECAATQRQGRAGEAADLVALRAVAPCGILKP